MAGLNRMILTGNLTRDPEIRFTKNEVPVAHFTVAVNGIPRNGEKGDVNFFNCVAWRGLANICGEYLKKGSSVAIEGKLRIKAYESKGVKKQATEIWVDNMMMLDKKFLKAAKDNTAEESEEAEGAENELVSTS
ncbi:MAG: single-stranded DNA-binding protein [Candidatus Saganbacteria bacterium]|nr:single-stranded DNA-binding protein [Candidatus Saganbacteria bacterium]